MKDRSRLHDWALLLPMAALALLVPPILDVFDAGLTAGGIPRLAIYIFTLWIILVVLCYRLSGLLMREPLLVPREGDVAQSSPLRDDKP